MVERTELVLDWMERMRDIRPSGPAQKPSRSPVPETSLDMPEIETVCSGRNWRMETWRPGV